MVQKFIWNCELKAGQQAQETGYEGKSHQLPLHQIPTSTVSCALHFIVRVEVSRRILCVIAISLWRHVIEDAINIRA
jgi:hypothetical protein